MAKKSVESFNVVLNSDHVLVEIDTENKKPHRYKIMKDDRHPNLADIADHLEKGLGLAKSSLKKIEIRDYTERNYVHIVTPEPSHSDQYTAHKLK